MKTAEVRQRIDGFLQENPLAAILAAVALGFVVGRITRSLGREPEPRPVRDALRSVLDQTREWDVDRYVDPLSRWWQRLWK